MSSKERTVIYEPHPVSQARKQELISKGYIILDARFAPEGYKHPESVKEETAKPVRKTRKVESEEDLEF